MTTFDSILSLDDGDIHVSQDGPDDAPVLLLIHGSASSTRSWDQLVPLLTGTHRVIRIDLLGHGRSAKPVDRDYAVPEQARRVAEALDRLGVERAVVAGHSSGGATATALAERRPDLVAALVLVNTGPAMDAYTAPQVAIEPAQWPHLTDEQIRLFASSGFSRPGYEIPQELLDEVRAMTFHSLTATMQGTIRYLQERTLPERLAPLGRPLLVIFGAEDRRWRPSSAMDYRAVPGAEIEMLPGLGHSPMLEDPLQTAAPLLAFAKAHAARAD
ncbi:alpha/beta fold hydrolase [Spirillospora sp. CA-253888]